MEGVCFSPPPPSRFLGGGSANLIGWAILLCTISRPIQIYLLSFVMNKGVGISRPIDAKTQHMLSFAGLRGVVAFACMVSGS